MASKVTKGFLILFWSLFIAGIAAVYMLFAAIANGSIGYMPPVEQLETRLTNTLHRLFLQMEKQSEVMPIVQTTESSLHTTIYHPIW